MLMFKSLLFVSLLAVSAGSTAVQDVVRKRVTLDTLASASEKAPKLLVAKRILDHYIQYQYNYPVNVSEDNLMEIFSSDGIYRAKDGPAYYEGKFVISDGNVCIRDLVHKDYPLKECRAIFIDKDGELWMERPDLAGFAVIPQIWGKPDFSVR